MAKWKRLFDKRSATANFKPPVLYIARIKSRRVGTLQSAANNSLIEVNVSDFDIDLHHDLGGSVSTMGE